MIAAVADAPVEAPTALTDEERLELMSVPQLHFECCSKIELTAPDGAKVRETPTSNVLQERMFEAQRWCEANGVPARFIVLKPRKKGCSTAAEHLGYHVLRRRPTYAVLMGEDDGGGDTLYGMLKVYAETDLFDWGFGFDAKDSDGEIAFGNGSLAVRATAKRPAKARGKTPQFIHCTEVAHWPTRGAIDGRLTMTALLNSIPFAAGTTVWAESTPNGVAGWFPETYRGDPARGLPGAVTLEERKAGKIGNGWIKVFAAWHEFKESSVPLAAGQRLGPAPTLTQADREARGRILYGWTDAQINWRRQSIVRDCGGDESKFDEEFPESEALAFKASGRRRFDLQGLTRLELMAASFPAPQTFRLDRTGEQATLQLALDGSGWLWIWEQPIENCRYLVTVDVASGAEQQRGSNNPDRHSVLVIREGYSDQFGTWHAPMLVARIVPPCHYAMSILAERIDLVSRWLCRCMTVVEVTGGRGQVVLELLKPLGTPTYERQRGQAGSDRVVNIPGWDTNQTTKPAMIETLATEIREDALDLRDSHLVSQLMSFVTHADGSEAAESGCFDDDVMALAIARQCRGASTPYRHTPVNVMSPRDIRRRLDQRAGRAGANAECT